MTHEESRVRVFCFSEGFFSPDLLHFSERPKDPSVKIFQTTHSRCTKTTNSGPSSITLLWISAAAPTQQQQQEQ